MSISLDLASSIILLKIVPTIFSPLSFIGKKQINSNHKANDAPKV